MWRHSCIFCFCGCARGSLPWYFINIIVKQRCTCYSKKITWEFLSSHLFMYFFSSDFSLTHVFSPFWVLSGTVSRLHAKSASLKWSICRSVLFKLMMTLICCVWSSVIGEHSSIFLKVDVFCFPLSCQEISRECMYFQDNLIFEDFEVACREVLFRSHCLCVFICFVIDSFITPLPVRHLHPVTPFTGSALL